MNYYHKMEEINQRLKNMYFPRGMILCLTVMFYVRRSVKLQRLYLMGHDFRNKKITNVFSHISYFLGSTLMCFSTFRKRKREKFAVEIWTEFVNKCSLNDCIVMFLLVSKSRSFDYWQVWSTLLVILAKNCPL